MINEKDIVFLHSLTDYLPFTKQGEFSAIMEKLVKQRLSESHQNYATISKNN